MIWRPFTFNFKNNGISGMIGHLYVMAKDSESVKEPTSLSEN
jgi:hypothetical protein